MKGRWTILALLCAAVLVYTLDRALLGVLAIPIQEETGISDIQFGVLNSAVFWAYAVCVPFAGLIGDRFDRRKIVAISIAVWSLMTVLAGFSCGFWTLLALVSVGITVPQTLYSPSANALIARVYRDSQATAMGFHQAAFYTGWLVSGSAVAALLACVGGWRSAYFCFGAAGVALGIVFAWRSRRVSLGESAAPAAAPIAWREALKAYFGCPSVLLAAIGYVSFVFVGFGYSAWGPKFVAEKFAVSPALAGSGVMFWHYAAAFAAILVVGAVTDRCISRWPKFRLLLQSAVLVLTAPVLVVFGQTSAIAVVWASAAVFGVLRGLFEANSYLSIFDVIPERYRSSAIGFTDVLAGLVGSLAPMLLGVLSEAYGSRGIEVGFAVFGGLLVLAAAALTVSVLFTFEKDRRRVS